MSEYIILKNGGEGLYEEKKSRFIAAAYVVNSEEEAYTIIESVKKKYWDARHNCHAFVIGNNNEVTRCSDDGEPSGTAGKPILEVILGMEIHNCLVVVTRYFGGTLLGTGGLVRAYTKAAKDALLGSSLAKVVPGIEYIVTADYTHVGKIQRIAADNDAVITGTDYAADVTFTISVHKDVDMVKLITEGTNGKATVNKNRDLSIEIPYVPD